MALAVLLAWSSSAQAATKLCLKFDPPSVEVPPNPSFIVDRSELDSLRIIDGPRFRSKHVREFAFDVEYLNEYYARITVDAQDGEVFHDPGFVGLDCKGNKYQVQRRWSASSAKGEPVLANDFGDVFVRWGDQAELAWTRVDWAQSPSDLERGLYGTRMARGNVDFPLIADAGAWVRIVRYSLDGSTRTWSGWVSRASDGSVQTSRERSSHFAKAAPRPIGEARAVPVNPTFAFTRGYRGAPRFAAIAADGRALPVELDTESFDVAVKVLAGEGTRFQLHELPIGPNSALGGALVATVDRSRDRRPELAEVRKAHSWSSLDLVLSPSSGPWPKMRVSWATTRAGLDRNAGSETVLASEMQLYDDTLGGVPPDFLLIYLRVAPVWGPGDKAPAWDGWISRDPLTGAIAFGAVQPVHKPELIAVAYEPPRATCQRTASDLSRAWLAIGLAGIVLALALARWALRRATPLA